MVNRLARLLFGLFLYGFTMAMMVESTLGLDPWDVFHEGLAQQLPLTFGQVVILVGAVVLLLWIPLRQMPGVGTIFNVIVIGLAADAGIADDQPARQPVVAWPAARRRCRRQRPRRGDLHRCPAGTGPA